MQYRSRWTNQKKFIHFLLYDHYKQTPFPVFHLLNYPKAWHSYIYAIEFIHENRFHLKVLHTSPYSVCTHVVDHFNGSIIFMFFLLPKSNCNMFTKCTIHLWSHKTILPWHRYIALSYQQCLCGIFKNKRYHYRNFITWC